MAEAQKKAPKKAAGTQVTKDQALAKARSAAVTYLTTTYRGEFNDRIQQGMKDAGFEWAPKPTEEEKAKAQLEALYEKFPNLRPTPPAQNQVNPPESTDA